MLLQGGKTQVKILLWLQGTLITIDYYVTSLTTAIAQDNLIEIISCCIEGYVLIHLQQVHIQSPVSGVWDVDNSCHMRIYTSFI